MGVRAIHQSIKKLFEDAGVTCEPSSNAVMGLLGKTDIDGLAISVNITPLRKSRYRGRHRMGSSALGYRLTVSVDSNVPIRFSVVHQGIRGSKLIAWVNAYKGIRKVPDDLLERYGLRAWCNDADWAENLLGITEVNVAITRLMNFQQNKASIGYPCVIVSPTNIQYFRRAVSIDEFDKLDDYIKDITTLHKSILEAAQPTKPAYPTYLERLFKKRPLLAGALTVGSILLFPVVIMLLIVSLVGLLL